MHLTVLVDELLQFGGIDVGRSMRSYWSMSMCQMFVVVRPSWASR